MALPSLNVKWGIVSLVRILSASLVEKKGLENYHYNITLLLSWSNFVHSKVFTHCWKNAPRNLLFTEQFTPLPPHLKNFFSVEAKHNHHTEVVGIDRELSASSITNSSLPFILGGSKLDSIVHLRTASADLAIHLVAEERGKVI
jgi:hypothetical protein